MRLNAAAQRAQVVAALKAGDDALLGVASGDRFEAIRDPGVILLDQAHLPQVVFAVRIEPGADENHLRAMGLQARHPVGVNQLSHRCAFGVGGHRHVDEVSGVRLIAIGVKRVLVEAHHQDAVIPRHDVFSAIAVVNVKIDDGHALKAVPLQRVFGGDSHVVEKAESHCLVAAGVVPRRAHRAEGVFHFARHHRVGRRQRRASAAQRGRPRQRVHGGVGIQLRIARATRRNLVMQALIQTMQGGDKHLAMRQLNVAKRCQGRLTALQCVTNARDEQAVFNRVQALGALGVATAHFVAFAVGVGKKSGLVHGGCQSVIFSGNVQVMDSQLKLKSILGQLQTVIVGKPAQIQDCVACLLSGGHLLIEDVPGVGKTTLAHALAKTFGFHFSRVQFTSDLMPSDLSGVSIYERGKEAFIFHPGPIFAQVLLADEINRASPKTQSALLEAMEEKQVTVEGETRPLPAPFFVIATQNPHDQLGTYALPESQLDRFLMRISLGYPDRAAERELLAGHDRRDLVDNLQSQLTLAEFTQLQQQVRAVHAAAPLLNYVQDLIAASRSGKWFLQGLSPRAGIAVVRAAKAQALLSGRDYVAPDDVQAILPQTISHRLIPVGDAGRGSMEQVRAMVEAVPLA